MDSHANEIESCNKDNLSFENCYGEESENVTNSNDSDNNNNNNNILTGQDDSIDKCLTLDDNYLTHAEVSIKNFIATEQYY